MKTRPLWAAVCASGLISGTARADLDDAGFGTRLLAGLSPASPGRLLDAASDSLQYSDAYRESLNVGMEVNYRLGNGWVPFARLVYTNDRGRNVPVGLLTSGMAGTSTPVVASFSNVSGIALNLGARYVFRMSPVWQPFVSGYAGATLRSALQADFSAASLGGDTGAQQVLSGGTRADAGVEAGIDRLISTDLSLGVNVAANYLASQNTVTTTLTSVGIANLAAHGPNWTFPLQLSMSYRF